MKNKIQKIFKQIKESFPEINSKLISSNKNSFMWSSPITGNIYYQKDKLKKLNFSDKALRGVLAHELSHQLDYKDKSILGRIYFWIKYKIKDPDFKRVAERKADEITINRGFGKELLQMIKESKEKFSENRFEKKIRPFHLSISEIEEMINRQN